MNTSYLTKELEEMSKQELGDVLNYLSAKVDSGRGTGAEVQILKRATEIYISKYESNLFKESTNSTHKCFCEYYSLMRNGCRCGGV